MKGALKLDIIRFNPRTTKNSRVNAYAKWEDTYGAFPKRGRFVLEFDVLRFASQAALIRPFLLAQRWMGWAAEKHLAGGDAIRGAHDPANHLASHQLQSNLDRSRSIR